LYFYAMHEVGDEFRPEVLSRLEKVPIFLQQENNEGESIAFADLDIAPEQANVMRRGLELLVFFRDVFPELEQSFSSLSEAIYQNHPEQAGEIGPLVIRVEQELDEKLRLKVTESVDEMQFMMQSRILHPLEQELLPEIHSVRSKAGMVTISRLYELLWKFVGSGSNNPTLVRALILSLVRILRQRPEGESMGAFADFLQRLEQDAGFHSFSQKQILNYAFEMAHKFGFRLLCEFPEILPGWSQDKVIAARKIIRVFLFFDGPSQWNRFDIASLLPEADDQTLIGAVPVLSMLLRERLQEVEKTPLVNPARWLRDVINHQHSTFTEWVRNIALTKLHIIQLDLFPSSTANGEVSVDDWSELVYSPKHRVESTFGQIHSREILDHFAIPNRFLRMRDQICPLNCLSIPHSRWIRIANAFSTSYLSDWPEKLLRWEVEAGLLYKNPASPAVRAIEQAAVFAAQVSHAISDPHQENLIAACVGDLARLMSRVSDLPPETMLIEAEQILHRLTQLSPTKRLA
jgi:hypothetical protein